MTNELQNLPPNPKAGKTRDNRSSRYHLSWPGGLLPAAPWCEFSAPETEDSSKPSRKRKFPQKSLFPHPARECIKTEAEWRENGYSLIEN